MTGPDTKYTHTSLVSPSFCLARLAGSNVNNVYPSLPLYGAGTRRYTAFWHLPKKERSTHVRVAIGAPAHRTAGVLLIHVSYHKSKSPVSDDDVIYDTIRGI